jgi:hypothetical protein
MMGGAGDDEGADPASTDDRDVLLGTLRDTGESVEGDRERLSHRSRIVVASVRHGAADRGRRRHVFREPAIDLQSERAVLGTEIGPVGEAPAAATAGDPGTGNDPVTSPKRRHLAACVDHPTHELVPQNDTRAAENRAMVPFGRVGAADRAADDLEQNLVGSCRVRFPDAFDPDVPRAVEDGSPQRLNTRSAP